MGAFWLVSAAWAEPCGEVRFDYAGQPACVALAVESLEAVRLRNGCAGPVLVDQRAVRESGSPAVVAPGGELVLAGVSAFTLGADGALWPVVAVPRCSDGTALTPRRPAPRAAGT